MNSNSFKKKTNSNLRKQMYKLVVVNKRYHKIV